MLLSLGSSSAVAQMESFLTASGIFYQKWPAFMVLYRSNSSNHSTGRAPSCFLARNEGHVHPGWSLGFLLGMQGILQEYQTQHLISSPAPDSSCDWGHPQHKPGLKGIEKFLFIEFRQFFTNWMCPLKIREESLDLGFLKVSCIPWAAAKGALCNDLLY